MTVVSDLKLEVTSSLRRGIIHSAFASLFLVPLVFFEVGSEGLAISLVLSALPMFFDLIGVLSDSILERVRARRRPRAGEAPQLRPRRRFQVSPFLTAFVLSAGVAFVPILDAIFPKRTRDARHGAALLGYALCLLSLLLSCAKGQQAADVTKGWLRRSVLIGAISLFASGILWRVDPAFRTIAIGTAAGMFVCGMLGYRVGFVVALALDALYDLWLRIKRMGTALGGFVLGYFLLVMMFSCIYAALWKIDNSSFQGQISSEPHLADFAYFSVVTASTLGYGDVVPVRPTVRLFAGFEVLLGLGWTIVGFAAMVSAIGEGGDQDGVPTIRN
jgi:hypothetical protein